MPQQPAASRDCHEHDRRNAHTMDVAMTAPLKTVEGSNLAALMREVGERARSSARALALAPTAQKDRALAAMAAAIRARQAQILAANAEDIDRKSTRLNSSHVAISYA